MNPIEVVEYDPLWPQQFQTLRERISQLLDGRFAAIEHVGSTSVPGLAAKRVIDVDVLLRSADDLPLVIGALAVGGYQHRGDLGIPGREAFKTPPGDIPHHLYVCPPASLEYRRHIAFRDYLRAHAEEASAYASLKRELAKAFRDDREAYNQNKANFVAGILVRTLTR